MPRKPNIVYGCQNGKFGKVDTDLLYFKFTAGYAVYCSLNKTVVCVTFKPTPKTIVIRPPNCPAITTKQILIEKYNDKSQEIL